MERPPSSRICLRISRAWHQLSERFSYYLRYDLMQSLGVGVGNGNMQIVQITPLHISGRQYRCGDYVLYKSQLILVAATYRCTPVFARIAIQQVCFSGTRRHRLLSGITLCKHQRVQTNDRLIR